jgi:hypothetical protein
MNRKSYDLVRLTTACRRLYRLLVDDLSQGMTADAAWNEDLTKAIEEIERVVAPEPVPFDQARSLDDQPIFDSILSTEIRRGDVIQPDFYSCPMVVTQVAQDGDTTTFLVCAEGQTGEHAQIFRVIGVLNVKLIRRAPKTISRSVTSCQFCDERYLSDTVPVKQAGSTSNPSPSVHVPVPGEVGSAFPPGLRVQCGGGFPGVILGPASNYLFKPLPGWVAVERTFGWLRPDGTTYNAESPKDPCHKRFITLEWPPSLTVETRETGR